MTTHSSPNRHPWRRLAAWGVHLFTASGAVWGLLSILAIQQHNWKLSFLWISLAILVDSVDGTLARRARVQEYAPGLDGALLDNIIDYLNYVIVPALFFVEARLLPPGWAIPGAALVVLVSAYQFSQADAKTEDHFFKGFPSYWNILAVYLLVLGLGPWLNLALVVLCAVLVFVPVKYIYPSRTGILPRLTQALTWAWGILWFLAVIRYPQVPMWLIWITLLYVGYYTAISLSAGLVKSTR